MENFNLSSSSEAVTSYEFEHNTSAIRSKMFSSYVNLSAVNIPDSVKIIEDGAFYKCESLIKIDLNNVTAIGDYALANCHSLSSIKNFSNVLSCGIGVLRKCLSL